MAPIQRDRSLWASENSWNSRAVPYSKKNYPNFPYIALTPQNSPFGVEENRTPSSVLHAAYPSPYGCQNGSYRFGQDSCTTIPQYTSHSSQNGYASTMDMSEEAISTAVNDVNFTRINASASNSCGSSTRCSVLSPIENVPQFQNVGSAYNSFDFFTCHDNEEAFMPIPQCPGAVNDDITPNRHCPPTYNSWDHSTRASDSDLAPFDDDNYVSDSHPDHHNPWLDSTRAPIECFSNMERRKEKSRDAARCRRSKEHEIFTDLHSTLPLSKADGISHLDKASIVRIAISYLKIRTVIESMPFNNDKKKLCTKPGSPDSLFLNALEGFLLVTTKDGDIVFISQNVNRYLGLSQVDVLGQSIYELSHPCDHAELKEMLSTKEPNSKRSYFLRMKCTLTNKGRNVNIKSASYKVIRYSGRMIECDAKLVPEEIKQEHIDEKKLIPATVKDSNSSEERSESSFHFVAVGEPISHPANIEIPLGRNTFLSKHSLDMKFTYADDKIEDFFGYNPKALVKKSIYDFHHAQDSSTVMDSFKSLISKGQAQTERYRFLALGGGYAWVLTEATLIYGSGSQQPQSVVCVNFVISEIEHKDEVYSVCQLADQYDDVIPNGTAGAAKSLAQSSENDALSRDVADGYLFEKLPQQLTEKLSIATPSSPRPSVPLALDDPSAFPLLFPKPAAVPAGDGCTNNSSDFFCDNRPTAVPSSSTIVSSSTISLSDFFPNSEPSDNPSPTTSPVTSLSYSYYSPSSSSLSPSSSTPSPQLQSANSSGSSSPSYPPLSVDDGLLMSGVSYDRASLPSTIVYHLPSHSNNNQQQEQSSQVESTPTTASTSPTSSPLSCRSPITLAETNVASSPDPSENGFQVTVGSTTNADEPSPDREKVFYNVCRPASSTIPETPKPTLTTRNLLVPFTEDMNKDFLRFTSDHTELTMLKEDPDDLTHLAPTAGDVCVPLDETPIVFSADMLEEFIRSDCNLLSTHANTRLSPQPPSATTSSSSPDSFFSCKDELDPSSRPHSPILTQNENGSPPSFGQDNDSSIHTESVHFLEDFSLMNQTDEMDDLSGKSSLLQLTLDQDSLFPLVTDNFMWCSSSDDSCALSSESNSPGSSLSPSSSSSPSSSASLSPRLDRNSSSLAKLLTADPICNYDGGGDRRATRVVDGRAADRKNANGHLSRRYQNGGTGNGASDGGNDESGRCRQGGANNPATTNRWSNRPQPATLCVKSRSDGNYYGDLRKYRATHNKNNNNNNGLLNPVKDVAKESNSRVEDRRRPQGSGGGSDTVVVGCKRGFAENWSRGGEGVGVGGNGGGAGANGGISCKRSKQTTSTNGRVQTSSSSKTDSGVGGDRRMRSCGGNSSSSSSSSSSSNNSLVELNSNSKSPPAAEEVASRATNSVLMNLLVSGCDLSAGYTEDEYREIDGADRLECNDLPSKKIVSLLNAGSTRIPSLMDLTEQDYAVNAPNVGALLQGSELLRALDCPGDFNLR